jgi:hypothetical protein
MISAQHFMINFCLMTKDQVTSGLVIELSPYPVGALASPESVFVSEAAFGFLEPSIRKHCSRYTEMSHWGITEVDREEWLAVIAEWNLVETDLAKAVAFEDYSRPRFLFSDVAGDFQEHFGSYREPLLALIAGLRSWFQGTLTSTASIAVKGV